MNKHKFTKEAEGWFIDLPQDLQRICHKTKQVMTTGANAVLKKLSHGDKKMTVLMDTEPINNAAVLELLKVCKAPMGGGYYVMKNYMGRIIKSRIWLCDIPLFVFGDLPERIYIKRIFEN